MTLFRAVERRHSFDSTFLCESKPILSEFNELDQMIASYSFAAVQRCVKRCCRSTLNEIATASLSFQVNPTIFSPSKTCQKETLSNSSDSKFHVRVHSLHLTLYISLSTTSHHSFSLRLQKYLHK